MSTQGKANAYLMNIAVQATARHEHVHKRWRANHVPHEGDEVRMIEPKKERKISEVLRHCVSNTNAFGSHQRVRGVRAICLEHCL